jgi:hypothetical protein
LTSSDITWTAASWEGNDSEGKGGDRLLLLATALAATGEGDGGLLTEDGKRLTFLREDEDGDDDGTFFLRRGASESLLLSPLRTEFTVLVEEIRSGVNTLSKAGPEHSSPKKTNLKKLFRN